MATKNFTKMTTTKLNALLATASDEDKAKIQAVLDARAQAETPAAQGQAEGQEYNDPDYTPSPEEEAAYEEAEKNGGKAPRKARRTEEEVAALAEELQSNIGHKCSVMPANTPEWVDGVITGVRGDKRAAQVFYAIKLDTGKSVVKAYDSNLLKIYDETIEITAKRRAKTEKTAWTDEDVAEGVTELTPNVGKLVTLEDGSIGRIVSIVPEKRSQTFLYRIEAAAPTEANPDATKTVHKVSTSTAIVIEPDFDEAGAEMNAKFIARREKAATKEPVTPEGKLAKAQELLVKAQESLSKAQATLDAREKALAEAQAEYDAWKAGQDLQ